MKSKSTLNEYHQKRNEEELKAAKEQAKKRYTYEEMKAVIHKSL